jgi:hypothetical protein
VRYLWFKEGEQPTLTEGNQLARKMIDVLNRMGWDAEVRAANAHMVIMEVTRKEKGTCSPVSLHSVSSAEESKGKEGLN